MFYSTTYTIDRGSGAIIMKSLPKLSIRKITLYCRSFVEYMHFIYVWVPLMLSYFYT